MCNFIDSDSSEYENSVDKVYVKICSVYLKADSLKEPLLDIIANNRLIKNYLFIYHFCDYKRNENGKFVPNAAHYHILLDFGPVSISLSTVAEWFGTSVDFVRKVLSIEDEIRYFLHWSNPSRFQYGLLDIYSNFNFMKYLNFK
jgi:hypothetical protein